MPAAAAPTATAGPFAFPATCFTGPATWPARFETVATTPLLCFEGLDPLDDLARVDFDREDDLERDEAFDFGAVLGREELFALDFGALPFDEVLLLAFRRDLFEVDLVAITHPSCR